MDYPLISVIIPCYNVEKCVSYCLESVINQTYKNLEIICVNDGSKDGTLDVLKKYAEKDSRIKIIDQPNKGVSAARNAALDSMNGDYLTFIDSDDFIDENFCSILYQLIKDYDSDIARARARGNVTSYDYKEPKSENKPEIYTRETQDALSVYYDGKFYGWFADNSAYVFATLFNSKIFNNIRFDEKLKIGEDDCLVQLAIGEANRVVYTDERLYFYYVVSTSLSHSPRDENLLFNVAKITYNTQHDYFTKKGYDNIRQKNIAAACNSFCELYINSHTTVIKKSAVKEFKKYYRQLNGKSAAYILFNFSPLLYKFLIKVKYHK